jgi:branched-chain amino acid transport system substrate-binding protein
MRYAQAVFMTVLVALAAMTTSCREKKTEEATSAGGPAAGGGPATAGDKIVVGHIGSMTGDNATFGKSTDDGLRLAIDEQNKKGGIKGKRIVLETLDDQGKPEEAAVAATRLATQDKVTVLFGEVASSRSLAMAPIADSNRVPMISNASTNPRVTKDGNKTRPYVFRVCFIDPFQGTVMAKFARETLKLTKVAVLRDVGNDYSVGLAQFFSTKFQELGGEIVADQSFKAGDQDFKAQLTAIKSKSPEAIYVPGYYTEVALIGRQARELGMKHRLMGGDGWDSEKLYEIAKGALDGSYFSNHYAPEDPSPLIQEFVKKYKSAHGGAVPDAMAVLGYDAANVAFAAIERAPDLSSAAIRDAIEQTKDFHGVSGVITLDKDHNAVKSAVVMAIENNAPKYAATISP